MSKVIETHPTPPVRCAEILLLDHEENELRVLLQTLIGFFGSAIDAVSDPEEALEILRQGDYKVLVLPYQMPRMNGVEVLLRAGQIAPDTVGILVLRGAGNDEVATATKTREVYRVVREPWSDAELCALVHEAQLFHESARRGHTALP